MHVFLSLTVGVFVGAVTRLIAPGRDPGGIGLTMLLGVVGAVVSNFLCLAIGMYAVDELGRDVLTSFLGSVALLAAYRCLPADRKI